MKIAFTFRHLEPSDWIKSYASRKVAKLQKLAHAPLEVTLTFFVERHLHCVDITVHANGEVYMAREEREDMYAAIDLGVDKLRQQLSRTKDAHAKSRRMAPAFGS